MTYFAMKKRIVVAAAVLVLILVGLNSLLTMSRREDPAIKIRVCVVVTEWPGASARKVEDLVTDPLEASIKDIDGVFEINSTSRAGLSIVNVELDERIFDVDQYWDEVRSRVDSVRDRLPDGVRNPRIDTDFGDVFSVIYALEQRPPQGRDSIEYRYSMRELEVFAETVQDSLRALPSVAKVDIAGTQAEQIYLDVDEREWAKIRLSTTELRNALAARNSVTSGGELSNSNSRFTVSASGEFETVDQIREAVVTHDARGLPVRVTDLPIRVRRGYIDPPTQRFRLMTGENEARNCLLLAVSMRAGSNVVEMGEEVTREIGRLEATQLPPDLALTVVNNLPRQVDNLVASFIENLAQAIGIVLLVAMLMMGWRAALIMATAIPLSILATIFLIESFGVELEQFSIASLIIALGMLVDNAIVVSDNALEALKAEGEESRLTRIAKSTQRLAIPLLTSTLTTISAFLPMLWITGSAGEYVRSLPIVVATTLAVSYLVALTVTPILCDLLLRAHSVQSGRARPSLATRILRKLPRRRAEEPASGAPETSKDSRSNSPYQRLLTWCLRHRLATLAVALCLVVGSLALVPIIGNQFFPGGMRDQFFVDVWLPEGSSTDATSKVCARVESLVAETKTTADGRSRLDSCVTSVGGSIPRIGLTSTQEQALANYGFLLINTVDASQSTAWSRELAERVQEIPGARINVRSFMLGPAIENPVEFSIVGDKHAVLREAADRVATHLRTIDGAVNPFVDWQEDGYRLHVEIDQARADLAGVSTRSVSETTDALISGSRLTTLREGDHTIPIVFRLAPEARDNAIESIDSLYVDGAAGKVPLSSVASVVTDWQPAAIVRRNARRRISVGCRVAPGYLPNAVSNAARAGVAEIVKTLPPGYELEIGGEPKETRESSEKFSAVFQISFVLILLVLITQYNSLLRPLIVLSTVPLALVGAMLGLLISGWPLGFMPTLGIISLAGIVINNAILLIDFIEEKLRSGMELDASICEAGAQRLRPIVLTTLTTVGGLLPLALLGGPMWAGMSWAMIFGLSLSTGLTLLVIPTIYATCARSFGMRTIVDEGAQ